MDQRKITYPESDSGNADTNVNHNSRKALLRRQLAGAALLCILVLGVKAWYPSGAEQLRRYLFADTLSPVERAVRAFSDQLQSGEPVREAVAAFRQVIDDAQKPDLA